MGLTLKKLFLHREYDDIYVDIDAICVLSDSIRVVLNYWEHDDKGNKVWGSIEIMPFDNNIGVPSDEQIYDYLVNKLM